MVYIIIGTIIHLMGGYVYIKDTIKGETKPNKISWFIWALAPIIAAIVAISDWAKLSVIPTFLSGIIPLVVFIISFFNKKAYWRITVFDYICGISSFLALVWRWITKNPIIAIIFFLIGDILASLPTIRKSFSHPETESKFSYIAAFLSCSMALFVFEKISFVEIAFPLYLVLLNWLFIVVLYRKSWNRSLKK